MHHPESSLQKLFSDVAQRMQISCTLSSNPCRNNPSLIQRPRIAPSSEVAPHLEAILKTAKRARELCLAQECLTAEVQEEIDTASDTWAVLHERQIRAWAEEALLRVRDVVSQVESPTSRDSRISSREKKPGFNYEYTPLLEKYFEYNAYPSAPDRAVLARKAMMTPRQIEVWFQNHRNRAKKEGKTLRRLTEASLPHEFSIRSLKNSMPYFTIPEKEQVTTSKPRISNDELTDEDFSTIRTTPRSPSLTDVLNPPRPSYAFPAIYAPRCEHDSIRTRFPPPDWFRKPVSSPKNIKFSVDMDAFIVDFSQKLHLRAPVLHPKRRRYIESWCATRTLVPPLAPHPALVRSSSIRPIPLSSFTALATSACLKPMESSKISTSPQSNGLTTWRKVSRLPERNPKNVSNNFRCSSVVSDCSRSPSPSTSSASLSSNPRRRSSSSSISSSSTSSGPPTPALPQVTLPDDIPESRVKSPRFVYKEQSDLSSHSKISVPALFLPGYSNHTVGIDISNSSPPQTHPNLFIRI